MEKHYFCQLLLALTQKEIKARYKHAVLGFLWIFINPVLQMLVMGFVFSRIFRFGIENYYLFLFTGLLPWNFFSQSLDRATQRIVWDRSLILKAKFPRSVIPLSVIFSNFFHFFVSWLVFFSFLLITGKFQFFTLSALLAQLTAIIFLLIFVSGLSLFTSALDVFYRDIAFIVQAVILIWFYATPIIYPLEAMPDKIRFLFYLNPLSGIFSLFRRPLVGFQLPFQILISQFLFIILIAILGLRFFNRKEKYFADWL